MARRSITDIGNTFIGKLNALFTYKRKKASKFDRECLDRFVQEMNTKAALLGMTNTKFYDPVGLQPISAFNSSYTRGYPEVYSSENANTITAIDALRMIIYARGVQHINDAWNIRSFTLTYKNGSIDKTATITSCVYSSSVYQSSIDALLTSYDILGGKTGTFGASPYYANNLVFIARSKSTGKVYAVANMSTSANTASDNRYINAKAALDKVDANGSTPSFSKGGCVVAELPAITPSLLNRADITLAYSYGKDVSIHPASTSKIITAIVLCENVLDLNQQVTVHEADRLPPSGYNFVAGDVLSLRNLLNCMLTESSCTSAMVIARVVGGILLERDNNIAS